MIGKYGIATPKTEKDKQQMKDRIGRDHFFFKVDPADAVVQTPHGNYEAFRWDFNQLDPMIRIALTVLWSRNQGVSIKDADAFLTRTGAFFNKSEYDLSYTDTDPDDWASAYPMYQRKGGQS